MEANIKIWVLTGDK
jgi:magnesium-transporting ATPase (P-type)